MKQTTVYFIKKFFLVLCPIEKNFLSLKVGYKKGGIVGVLIGAVVSIATSYTTSFYYWFVTYSFLFGVANNLIYNTGMQMANAFFP